ncbi:MAG: acetyl-coenzyme A synthetase, partial [Candidatus Heimdallarchaeota archaeon]|nr:acetyl-coenzyme A synthetase [Candidatus Heimdallarchaeota archaeon]
AESAVIPYPHSIKGATIFAYITLMQDDDANEDLKKEIQQHVRTVAGPAVYPEIIMFAEAVPKTRSGKIMRRILKAVAEEKDIGNTMTLANPEVVEGLIARRKMMGEIRF